MDLKGRHFLTLKDYTQEEITYLLELSAELKAKKKQGILVDTLRGKNVALIFEKPVREPDVPLRLLPMIWEWEQRIWIQRVLSLERKRVLRILPEFWEVCLTALNIVGLDRKS